MARLTFVEVDPEDIAYVQEAFPDADVVEEHLESDALYERCSDTEILSHFITTEVTKEIIDHLPNLKLLCTRSVGYNHIDLDACRERGITVCHVPDYGSHVIAEHVFALLLSTLRHIPEGDARVESGEFDYRGLRGMSLRGKTMGIIGTGRIGRKVAQIAHGFGMHICAVDRCRVVELEDLLRVQYVSLDTLLAQSDILSFHLPANDETYHMINADAFSKMRNGVVLVNTARGELIDSQALLDALHSGKVAHALLDVLEHEQNFEENRELIEHPNVVTTPHIAFYAEESMRNMYDDCFVSIHEWERGEVPEHIVKPLTVVCDLEGVKKE